MNFRPFPYLFFFVCGNNYTYLECGNKGEPIEGGCVCNPPVDVVVPSIAAVSGWRKFLRWSTRSWCCVRHRVRISGSDSIWSWTNLFFANWMKKILSKRSFLFAFLLLTWTVWIFSSRLWILSSKASCRVDISDTISYTVFWVLAMSVIVFALSMSFRWSIFTFRNLRDFPGERLKRNFGKLNQLSYE